MTAFPGRADAGQGSAVLDEAVVRSERVISVLRAFFCTAAALRFVVIHATADHPGGALRGMLVLPTMACMVLFSLWMLRRTRESERIPIALLRLSVLAEALACSLALLANVLWPWPTYGGVIRLPETVTFLILVIAAAFRVLPRIVLFAAVSATVGLAGLVILDHWLNRAVLIVDEGQISLYAITMLVTAALAYLHARRTERLVGDAARLGASNARAQMRLAALMQGHHDALSVLSSALFSLERVKGDSPQSTPVVALEQDLARLRGSMVELKQLARVEVTALGEPVAVDVVEVLTAARHSFERAVHPMRVTWSFPRGPVNALVAGGRVALERLAMNLLVNAREGTGPRGAQAAWVTIGMSRELVWLAVQDDGPGMPQGWSALSTKPGGSGSGCAFVAGVVSASGGTVAVENSSLGALVVVTLPACEEPGLFGVSSSDRAGRAATG
jgi:signal transduction histidine kinase